LKGLKILAPALERPVNERELYPVWEMCERLGIPALIHFGMLGAGGGISWNGRDNPGLLEQVAKTSRRLSSSSRTSASSTSRSCCSCAGRART